MLGFHSDSKKQQDSPSEVSPVPLHRSSAQGSKRLGEILMEEGLINNLALEEALEEQKRNGGFIGEILVSKGFAKQADILLSLVKQCKIPHLSLLDYEINKEVLKLVPKEICFKYNLLPIDRLGRILTVAMVNPLDDEALDEVRKACPELRIKPILCDWQHFDTVASRAFNQPRDRNTGAYDHLSKPTHDKPAEAPAPDNEAMQAALNEAVAQVIKSAEIPESLPTPDVDLAPTALDAPPFTDNSAINKAIRDSVAAAMQEAMATFAAQMKPQPRQDSLDDLAATVKGALTETPAAREPAAAPEEDLTDTLRSAVRDALRESESVAVVRANRMDLEMRDRERNKRLRHASVSAFGQQRRRPLDSAQDPELREESDQRVIAAMNSDRLLDGFTFDGFCVGTANAFTNKICRAVADRPGADYNPLFLYGDVGLGKTHLINATGSAILDTNRNARVGYVSSSRFATRLGEAMREQAVDVFRENYCHWEVLILDDIQFLGGRIEAQEEFFHIFNVLQQEGRQIIIAGDKPPDRLGMLEQRLISRFAGGIVVNLKPPERETRIAILHRAAETGPVVDDEILSLIAMRVATDVRKMLGALHKIQAYAELEGKEVSCELASEILSHLGFNEAA